MAKNGKCYPKAGEIFSMHQNFKTFYGAKMEGVVAQTSKITRKVPDVSVQHQVLLVRITGRP